MPVVLSWRWMINARWKGKVDGEPDKRGGTKMRRGQITRREFMGKGLLAALAATMAACTALDESPTMETFSSSQSRMLVPNKDLHEARYYRRLAGNVVQCEMCFRNCVVPEGEHGFCRNKVNIRGRYFTLVYGRPSALQMDLIEKEPAFHVLPGGIIFCTGTASCNFRCKFCQNWHLSQRHFYEVVHRPTTPEETVKMALDAASDAVSFTYNEPTVFYEHMFDVVKAAKAAGLRTLCHTNGGMNEEPLAALLEHMDAVTVDLKGFSPRFYREVCGAELEPVLRTLRQIYHGGVHLEIVNLIIPTLNDDLGDIRRMCRWICEKLSGQVPIHFNRFFPAYKLTNLPSTPVETLEAAAEIADEEGLEYVYIGNYPGHERNSTFCPSCGKAIIRRAHSHLIVPDVERGRCSFCSHTIPGIWWDA